MNQVNINADLGEGAGQDELIMPFLTSCNIACGGHIGNRESITEAIKLAKKHGVKIGAHPSYPDRESFGRIRPNIDRESLLKSLCDQLELFFDVAEQQNMEVHHIKAHGALYNDASKDENTADLLISSFEKLDARTKIYTPYGSVLHQKAKGQFDLVFEAFIDRQYNDDLTLVNRSDEGSLHETPERAWSQLREMHFLRKVQTKQGNEVGIKADTYCIHGDHPEALNILKYISKQLSKRTRS